MNSGLARVNYKSRKGAAINMTVCFIAKRLNLNFFSDDTMMYSPCNYLDYKQKTFM